MFDLMSINPDKGIEYTTPIYTQLNGVYGYLVVNSSFNIHFIWNDEITMYCDDVSDNFRVEYKITSINKKD